MDAMLGDEEPPASGDFGASAAALEPPEPTEPGSAVPRELVMRVSEDE
jgi:hypothetical protein